MFSQSGTAHGRVSVAFGAVDRGDDGDGDAPGAKLHRWRVVGVVTFVGAALLLLTFGAGIVAAPLTLPVMFLASRRHPTRAFRLSAMIVGGLTAAEVGWAITYLSLGESRPWIWLIPLCSGLVAAWVYAAPNSRSRDRFLSDSANVA